MNLPLVLHDDFDEVDDDDDDDTHSVHAALATTRRRARLAEAAASFCDGNGFLGGARSPGAFET
jgi:hypothetical protein